jgi:hypothetical protein
MPKARQLFRRTDIMRGIRAVIDSGLSVSMVRIREQQHPVHAVDTNAKFSRPRKSCGRPTEHDLSLVTQGLRLEKILANTERTDFD